MIIAPYHRFLRADVEGSEKLFQVVSIVCLYLYLYLYQLWRSPFCRELHRRQTFVHELHGEPGNRLLSVDDMKNTAGRKFSQNGRLDAKLLRHRQELSYLLRWHRHTHPLLRLRDKYFPWVKSCIFKRCLSQIHPAAAAFSGHFADGG